ncbi:MAG: response regulator [Cyanobacteria bacterium J055]|nr:MAG: response regulator [Cyanobacteria bacterium J055]
MNRLECTLLVVDDSPEDRELYRRYLLLDRDRSYAILEAELGERGLELWHHHQPDAVLLALHLPDMDGLESIDRLYGAMPDACLPIVMVTGQGNEAIVVCAIKTGRRTI